MMPTGHSSRLIYGLLVSLALLAAAAGTVAQSAEDGPISEASGPVSGAFKPELGEGPILLELFTRSILINSVILALSLVAVLLFAYLLLTLKGHTMAPPRFVEEINKLIRARDYEQAAAYCRTHQMLFIASIVQRSVENSDVPHATLLDMIDAEGRRCAAIVWNRVSYLSDIASVAPMLGLLGTVLGMIEAFFGLEYASGSINSKVLSNAIGGAMATTLFGLIVGILALVFNSIVKGRLTRALAEAEQVVHGIADQIKRGVA